MDKHDINLLNLGFLISELTVKYTCSLLAKHDCLAISSKPGGMTTDVHDRNMVSSNKGESLSPNKGPPHFPR